VFPPVPQTSQGPVTSIPYSNEIRRYEPPLMSTAPSWQPARLDTPEGTRPANDAGAQLQPPRIPGPQQEQQPKAKSISPALPVGIPQFAMAEDQVAAGLRPFLDGLDWLKENGYKTVVHIHREDEDDAADRRQFEKRGLKYVAFVIKSEGLSKKQLESFSQFVEDKAGRPVFVYDKDGTLAGAVWYAHFRVAGHDDDRQARAKASRLGLKDDQTAEGKARWPAIQALLDELKL
jgi:protein tyrosine phosphatase (PTP) superfamily phosphohydrolase (DUF442 family)